MKLDQAIEVLSSTYMSLEAVARGLEVDPVEIEKALAKAEPDTTEFVCLTTLAKVFINKTPQESTSNDSTDTEQQ